MQLLPENLDKHKQHHIKFRIEIKLCGILFPLHHQVYILEYIFRLK